MQIKLTSKNQPNVLYHAYLSETSIAKTSPKGARAFKMYQVIFNKKREILLLLSNGDI